MKNGREPAEWAFALTADLRWPITSLRKPIGNWQLPIGNVSAAVCSAVFVPLRIASRAISRL